MAVAFAGGLQITRYRYLSSNLISASLVSSDAALSWPQPNEMIGGILFSHSCCMYFQGSLFRTGPFLSSPLGMLSDMKPAYASGRVYQGYLPAFSSGRHDACFQDEQPHCQHAYVYTHTHIYMARIRLTQRYYVPTYVFGTILLSQSTKSCSSRRACSTTAWILRRKQGTLPFRNPSPCRIHADRPQNLRCLAVLFIKRGQ